LLWHSTVDTDVTLQVTQVKGQRLHNVPAADVPVQLKGQQEEVMWLCRYRSEVQRLRNVFRSAVAGDVARLKEAVGEYKENTSRLECQKQLLLKQASVLCSHHVHHSSQHTLSHEHLRHPERDAQKQCLECQKQLLLKQASVLCSHHVHQSSQNTHSHEHLRRCEFRKGCAETTWLECQKQLLLKQASVLCSRLLP